MSQADELLDSLTEDQVMTASIDPATEPHIMINADRTITVPEELMHIAVQGDHNIETVIFDCPRYWDGRDLSAMSMRIVFQRPDGHREPYPVENLRIDETDDTVIHFDWTISGNVTEVMGNISFLVCAKLSDVEGVRQNEWHTRLNQDLIVDEGMDCSGDDLVEQNPDIIESILVRLDNLESGNTSSGSSSGSTPNVVIPQKLSDLENDLFYRDKRIELIALTRDDFQYYEGDGWLYLGGDNIDLPESVDNVGYSASIEVGDNSTSITEEDVPLVYEDGFFMIGDVAGFAKDAELGFVVVALVDLDLYTRFDITVYHKGTKKIPGDLVDITVGGADHTFLNGLKYYAEGDSIVSMQGTQASPVTFGSVGYNSDLQGRDIADQTVNGYVTAIESRYGLVATNYGAAGHTLVQDYATLAALDYSDVALVTIAYGVNDARTGVPLGTVNSTDITTFAGALNGLLKKIYTDNPECRVLVLAPLQRLTVTEFGIATPNANGDYLIDFVDMCHKVAEKRSTICIDQYRKCGINQTNLYYYTVEGVHPVNQGFARIKAAIIGVLDEMFALEYEPFGTMSNSSDTEPDAPETGGDSGDDETPEEETGATEVDLTGVFDQTGYWFDGSASWSGDSDIMSNSKMIELIPGKTYTYETYVTNRYESTWAYLGVLAYNEDFPATTGGITVQTNKSWGGTSTYEANAATFNNVNHAKVTLTWVAQEDRKWLHTIRSAYVTDNDVKLSYI